MQTIETYTNEVIEDDIPPLDPFYSIVTEQNSRFPLFIEVTAYGGYFQWYTIPGDSNSSKRVDLSPRISIRLPYYLYDPVLSYIDLADNWTGDEYFNYTVTRNTTIIDSSIETYTYIETAMVRLELIVDREDYPYLAQTHSASASAIGGGNGGYPGLYDLPGHRLRYNDYDSGETLSNNNVVLTFESSVLGAFWQNKVKCIENV